MSRVRFRAARRTVKRHAREINHNSLDFNQSSAITGEVVAMLIEASRTQARHLGPSREPRWRARCGFEAALTGHDFWAGVPTGGDSRQTIEIEVPALGVV